MDKVRAGISNKLAADRKINILKIYADSIDDALEDAAIQFRTKVPFLDYDILEHGRKGIIGLGQKPWFIRVNNLQEIVQEAMAQDGFVPEEQAVQAVVEVVPDTDAVFFVRRFGTDIMLKVIPPSGTGKPVTLQGVMREIGKSDNTSVDQKLIERYMTKGTDNMYMPVGMYSHNQNADTQFDIQISQDEMEGIITAKPAERNGADISSERVLASCRALHIVDNVDYSPMEDFIDHPVYNQPVIIVKGIKAKDGADAHIEYLFETDKSKVLLKETAGGQVNFKETNLIQNVVKGQTVAQKKPAELGVDGRTLYGKILTPRNGVDVPLPLGNNVHLDGNMIVADINGKVELINGKITIESVMQVDSVSIKSGNIVFHGTIIVKGNVDDGFSVKASGDVEVKGLVGMSSIEADGNVVVANGVFGRDKAVIRSGKSIWAKFVQNARLEAIENVIVADGIISSHVIAHQRIILNGRRAVIVGGHLFAKEEINAKTIGTSSELETLLEVGYDIAQKKRFDELSEKRLSLAKTLEGYELNITSLQKLKQKLRELPMEKETALAELMEKRDQITIELVQVNNDIKDVRMILEETKLNGVISVSDVVYPGTRMVIRDARQDLKTEVHAVTFFYKDGTIERGKYVPSQIETSKDGARGKGGRKG
ncbi:MAG: FapA family protein [Spirochaetaceae bacterium]|nr:FapA family protein [Spirochaetaceae bacterium]